MQKVCQRYDDYTAVELAFLLTYSVLLYTTTICLFLGCQHILSNGSSCNASVAGMTIISTWIYDGLESQLLKSSGSKKSIIAMMADLQLCINAFELNGMMSHIL